MVRATLASVDTPRGLDATRDDRAQVERMIAHPRSKNMVENFAGQWLHLRKLRNAAPDTATYTAFDENLREAMRRETELFLEHELLQDNPLVNMLQADYTFLNERLAKHYEIPYIYGTRFRRVSRRSICCKNWLGGSRCRSR